jgi:hypothetical protein
MGVLIPINPASGYSGFRFFPFEQARYWGEWKEGAGPGQTPGSGSSSHVVVIERERAAATLAPGA